MDDIERMYDEIAMNMRRGTYGITFKGQIEALSQLGVPLKDSNGNYRPLFDVLQDLARIWEKKNK